jgi:uncharacterized protein involved in exopolysaccharide biosynthesis
MQIAQSPAIPVRGEDDVLRFDELLSGWQERWRVVGFVTVLAGIAGLGVAFLMTPIYSAETVILPPQPQGSSAASALGPLSALAGLTGASLKSPAEQYASLMTSVTVSDRIIDRFGLMKVYDTKYMVDARKMLATRVAINIGKKDGLIAIEVDDADPKRAADMANAYVDNLRTFTNTLAVTEAQQRRSFFETKLKETQQKLTESQIALQASGFNGGALNAEPSTAASLYARLDAEVTSAQVKLDSMRSSLADTSPEVHQQQTTVDALRSQLSRVEKSQGTPKGSQGADYITKFRDFKYQETLFELYARQYEAARVDESREGALIQVVDPARPPERKSKPKRLLIAIGAAAAGFLLSSLWALSRVTRTGVRHAPSV